MLCRHTENKQQLLLSIGNFHMAILIIWLQRLQWLLWRFSFFSIFYLVISFSLCTRYVYSKRVALILGRLNFANSIFNYWTAERIALTAFSVVKTMYLIPAISPLDAMRADNICINCWLRFSYWEEEFRTHNASLRLTSTAINKSETSALYHLHTKPKWISEAKTDNAH